MDSSTHKEEKQPQVKEEDDDIVLDLRLSDQESNRELNFIDCFEVMDSSADHDQYQGNETEPRVFSCNYCRRNFYSPQALGGHQNAHKRERTLTKRGHRIAGAGAAAFGYPNTHHPGRYYYYSMASLPSYGSDLNKPVGVQEHSMIHKPSFVPCHDRTRPIGHLSMGTNATARFEGGERKFGPAMEGMGGFLWDTVKHFNSKKDELELDLSLKL